jgi:hypothetical protein
MKKFLVAIIILLILFVGQSCKKSSSQASTNNNYTNDTTPLITSVGTPVGSPASKTIDASGGTIISPDGVLKLIIPAGALSAATNISIQPVTNEIPIALYKGYSLTPNGQQFQTPVTLEFHYNDLDMDTVDPGGLTVAYQIADQSWEAFTDVTIDTIKKTVSVQSTHFTIFDLLPNIRIYPEQAIVPVGKQLSIFEQIHWDANPNSRIPSFVRLTDNWENTTGHIATPTSEPVWAVNNIAGGSPTYGIIVPQLSSTLPAIYKAPSKVPSPSTVWVTSTEQVGSSKIILRSKITIVDGSGYHVKMSFQTEDSEGGSYFNWKDEGSFDVIISGNTGLVQNITNPNANIELDSNTSTCITTLAVPPVGPINIVADSSSVFIVPGSNVSVFFNALSRNNYIRDAVWSAQCPGAQPVQSGGGYYPPFPDLIQFKITDNPQTIVSGQYTIVVTPIK